MILSTILIIILIAAACAYWWIRDIPSDPAHVALVKFLGAYERPETGPLHFDGRVKGPGWRLFAFLGLIYDYTLISIESVNIDLSITGQGLRVPDNAFVSVQGMMTIEPAYDHVGSEGGDPGARMLINFVKRGKMGQQRNTNQMSGTRNSGVISILASIYHSQIREFFSSECEGPQNWEEATQAKDETMLALLRKMAGDSILGSPKNQALLLEYEQKSYRAKRHSIPDLFHAYRYDKARCMKMIETVGFPQSKMTDLLMGLHELTIIMQEIYQGQGNVVIEDLGIRIRRLNLKEIIPLRGVAEMAEKKASVKARTEGEKVEIETFQDMLTSLTQTFINAGVEPRYAAEMAREEVNIQRGKWTPTVEKKQYGMDPSTINALPDLVTSVTSLFGKKTDGEK